MEKVKVNEKVFEALEEAKKHFGLDNYGREIIEGYMKRDLKFKNLSLGLEENLWKYGIGELFQILNSGYEVEVTPEEKILATFERQSTQPDARDICDKRVRAAYANAILYTLNTLGIKIKGINS